MTTAAEIVVRGARENNLHDVDLRVPLDQMTVFTGVSGSGKSSLVFDTIAAESQRQLNETFPAFVRNRLPQLGKPDVDALENLSASVVIDQRPFGGNARSTVGTATDLAPLLRLLWSRAGTPFVGYSNVFSFNQPAGMCPRCQGLGTVDDVDEGAILDRSKSLAEGAIRFPSFAPGTAYWKRYAHAGLFDVDRPLGSWPTAQLDDLLHAEPRVLHDPPPQWYASAKFEGIVPRFRRVYLSGKTASADKVKARYPKDFERIVTTRACPECGGARLRPEVLRSAIAGASIADASRMPVSDLQVFLEEVRDARVRPVVEALLAGLTSMVEIGLGYLSLDRVASSLSGGEAQRVKMIRNLGSSLSRMTYVLDEPSVGLHPADVHRLTELLGRLRDHGNTVLVVEHDPDVIVAADHVVDLGPEAGDAGGRIVFEGTVAGLRRAHTPTGDYLRRKPRLKPQIRTSDQVLTTVRHARLNNLRDVSVDLPAGVLCVLTGVAGSGKSSLLQCVLRSDERIQLVDQRPLRGARRSSAASWLGVLDPLRRAFADANEVGVGWFSSGSDGACPVCHGNGIITTELAFMDDVETVCDACSGSGFNDTALSYRLDGLTIADALAVAAVDATDRFAGLVPPVADAAARMTRCGIGYLALGRRTSSLSGGERQRLKLARELEHPAQAYAFDEPTTGLHGRDIDGLLGLFDDLVDSGISLLIIEHDLDVMAHADWIVDVGPGAGEAGGSVIFAGTPADLVAQGDTPTAEHLARWTRR